jgi:hypothetical protein
MAEGGSLDVTMDDLQTFNAGFTDFVHPLSPSVDFLSDREIQRERLRELGLTVATCACTKEPGEATLHYLLHFGVTEPAMGFRRSYSRWVRQNIRFYQATVTEALKGEKTPLEELLDGIREAKRLSWIQLFTLARSIALRMVLIFRDRKLYVGAYDEDDYNQEAAFLVLDEYTFLPCERSRNKDAPEYSLRFYDRGDWRFGGYGRVKEERMEGTPVKREGFGSGRSDTTEEIEVVELDSDDGDTEVAITAEQRMKSPRHPVSTTVSRSARGMPIPSMSGVAAAFSYQLSEENVQQMKIESLIAEVELIRSKARNEVLKYKSEQATEGERLRKENEELRKQTRIYREDNQRLQQAMKNISSVVDRALDDSTAATGNLILPMMPASTATSTPGVKSGKRKRTPFSCFHCEEAFEESTDRRDHMREEHGEEQVYDCPESTCAQYYKHEYTLRRHVAQYHTDKEEHKCTYTGCGKTFRTQQGLQDHAGLHTNEYACYWCDTVRPFSNLRTLRRHVREAHADVYDEDNFQEKWQARRDEHEAARADTDQGEGVERETE